MYYVGGKHAHNKGSLGAVVHGTNEKVSMFLGDKMMEKMYALSNKQEISDICFIDIQGKSDSKKCLFNSNEKKMNNTSKMY